MLYVLNLNLSCSIEKLIELSSWILVTKNYPRGSWFAYVLIMPIDEALKIAQHFIGY